MLAHDPEAGGERAISETFYIGYFTAGLWLFQLYLFQKTNLKVQKHILFNSKFISLFCILKIFGTNLNKIWITVLILWYFLIEESLFMHFYLFFFHFKNMNWLIRLQLFDNFQRLAIIWELKIRIKLRESLNIRIDWMV